MRIDVRPVGPSGSTSLGSAVLFLGFGWAFGLGIIGIALGWIPYDPAQIHAPTWVLVATGLVFMGAGGWPLASRLGLSGPGAQPLIMGAIMIGVGVVTTWMTWFQPNPTVGGAGASTARAMVRVTTGGFAPQGPFSRVLVVLLDVSFVLFALWAVRSWARGRRAGRG